MESVLLVQNDQKILSSLVSIFSNNNFEVVTASNSNDAVRQIYESSPSAIISDINLPKQSGIEFYNKVRNDVNFKATPFFFISSNTQNEIIKIKDRYTEIIKKPYKATQIISKVNDKLKERKIALTTQINFVDSLEKDFSNELNGIEDQLKVLSRHAEKLSKEEIIDFISRIKIGHNKISSKIKKHCSYNQLLFLQKNLVDPNNKKKKKIFDSKEIENLAAKTAKEEFRESDLSIYVERIELKVDPEILTLILREAIENTFKHSWSYSPVEIIAVEKNNEYAISFTNYSSKSAMQEINNSHYGMKIIDAACQLLNCRFQITQVAKNCVKSRLTLTTNK